MKGTRFGRATPNCLRRLSVIEVNGTRRQGWDGGSIRAEYGLVTPGSSRSLMVLAAALSCSRARIVRLRLMLRHATVLTVSVHGAHDDAIHYLRIGKLRRQSDGEDYGDYACNADTMKHHVSKLHLVRALEVRETPAFSRAFADGDLYRR